MPLKIAIIGAGPAGCTLARLLQQSPNPIPIQTTIFESEPRLPSRSQGGTLDLHPQTGQAALRAAGLWDAFQRHARYDGEALKISDKDLLCYVSTRGREPGAQGGGRPEIDRKALREVLFHSLEPGTVRWERKLVSVDEERRLHFADGSVESGYDLIVGADGAWSRVRPRLTPVQPFYSGIGGHALQISSAESTHPDLFNLVNRGSLFAFSDGKSLTAQHTSTGTLQIGTWRLLPPSWQKDACYDIHSPAAVKAALAQDYADWYPRLQAFIHAADDEVVPRDLYMLPIGHTWEHVPGVTLVGDAAHLMTPFAGEGVNLALEDVLLLSRAIIAAAGAAPEEQKEVLDGKVAEFERGDVRPGEEVAGIDV